MPEMQNIQSIAKRLYEDVDSVGQFADAFDWSQCFTS